METSVLSVILLFGFCITLTLCFYELSKDWRISIVTAYLILFFIIAVSTEILSLFNAIKYDVFVLLWGILFLTGIIMLFKFVRYELKKESLLVKKTKLGIIDVFLLGLICFILSITLLIALKSPPNNWDSMTYHMSRVAEWIQHENIKYYATSIDRQNWMQPLAEYAILHLQLLSVSDNYANLVQWCSFFVSILLASLLAKELNAGITAQIFSGLFVAAMPMAVLQSTSTQTDLVTTAFCLAFAYFLLKFVKFQSWENLLLSSIAFGLALLAKGTAYTYCAVIGLSLGGVALLVSKSWKAGLILAGKLILICILGILLNVGFYARSYAFYGSPLPEDTAVVRNEEYSARILFSNAIRNADIHLTTSANRLNHYLYRGTQLILGNELNNPKSTFGTFEISFTRDEDYAGNLIPFIMIGITLLAVPLVLKRDKKIIPIYAAIILLLGFSYCALLKWQPWGSRLQTPIFALSASFVGIVFERISSTSNTSKKWFGLMGILLIVFAVPYLLFNNSRPFLAYKTDYSIFTKDRTWLYFSKRSNMYRDYKEAIKVALNERENEIGLFLGADDWEYPFWVLAGRNAQKGLPLFEHVGVENNSGNLNNSGKAMPAIIISTKPLTENKLNEEKYLEIFTSKYVRVYKLESILNAPQ
jgi:hypothetical protein